MIRFSRILFTVMLLVAVPGRGSCEEEKDLNTFVTKERKSLQEHGRSGPSLGIYPGAALVKSCKGMRIWDDQVIDGVSQYRAFDIDTSSKEFEDVTKWIAKRNFNSKFFPWNQGRSEISFRSILLYTSKPDSLDTWPWPLSGVGESAGKNQPFVVVILDPEVLGITEKAFEEEYKEWLSLIKTPATFHSESRKDEKGNKSIVHVKGDFKNNESKRSVIEGSDGCDK